MAKFSQYTINQVAGFDSQVLAQKLVYNQKDFWNFAWAQNVSVNGWTTNSTPIDLTGVTINAQIIRRQITDLTDSRGGIDFTIVDYPFPAPITVVTDSDTNGVLTAVDTKGLFVDQPIQFTGTVFGGVAINTTYYVSQIITATTFTISETQGGPVMTLSNHNNGDMVANRVAPSPITLPISNRDDAAGTFTMTIDDDTWDVIAGDPELDINANNPVCFTGRVKLSFPPVGSQPAYDEQIYLLFLIVSDGVVN